MAGGDLLPAPPPPLNFTLEPFFIGEVPIVPKKTSFVDTLKKSNSKQTAVPLGEPENYNTADSKLSLLSKGSLQLKPLASHLGKPSVIFQQSDKTRLIARLKYVLIAKFSHGRPPIEYVHKFLLGSNIKGNYTLSVLDVKHMFIEFSLFEDFTRIWLKRNWVIKTFPVRFFKWTAEFVASKESSIVPVWVHLPSLPLYLFEEEALLSIANAIGKPLHIDRANLNRTKLGYATFCVEMDVSQPQVDEMWIEFKDESSNTRPDGFWQRIVYDVIPPFCVGCQHLGHKVEACKRISCSQPAAGLRKNGEQGLSLDKLEVNVEIQHGYLEGNVDIAGLVGEDHTPAGSGVDGKHFEAGFHSHVSVPTSSYNVVKMGLQGMQTMAQNYCEKRTGWAAVSDKLGNFEVAAGDQEQVDGGKGMNQLNGMLVQPFHQQLFGEHSRSDPVLKGQQQVDCRRHVDHSIFTGLEQIVPDAKEPVAGVTRVLDITHQDGQKDQEAVTFPAPAPAVPEAKEPAQTEVLLGEIGSELQPIDGAGSGQILMQVKCVQSPAIFLQEIHHVRAVAGDEAAGDEPKSEANVVMENTRVKGLTEQTTTSANPWAVLVEEEELENFTELSNTAGNVQNDPVFKEEQKVDCKFTELSNTAGNVQNEDNSDGTGAATHLEHHESEDTCAAVTEVDASAREDENIVVAAGERGKLKQLSVTPRKLSSAAAEFIPKSAVCARNETTLYHDKKEEAKGTTSLEVGVEDEHEWEEGLWESLCKINKEKKRAKKEKKKEIKKKKEGKNFALNQTSTRDGFVPNRESFLSDEMCDIITAFKTNSAPNSPSSRKCSFYSVDYSPASKAVLAKYGADTSPYYGCRGLD